MYTGVFKVFDRYWHAYGGARALFTSFYLHLAVLLLALTFHYWLRAPWWEQSLSVLPSLLGFSLGGFAMFLGFGDEKFRAMLAMRDDDEKVSSYMSLCTSFVHFILIQFLGLIAAVIAKALAFDPPADWGFAKYLVLGGNVFSGVGYLLLLYSITSMMAATMAVYRMCSMYEKYQAYLQAQAKAQEQALNNQQTG